jgi:Fic family protein
MNFREQKIFEIISEKKRIKTPQIQKNLLEQNISVSEMTITRDLKTLIETDLIQKIGKGKSTEYKVSNTAQKKQEYNIDSYFTVSQEKRNAIPFSFSAFLGFKNIFSKEEKIKLDTATRQYKKKIAQSHGVIREKEIERLTIDLAWKSSQIEGNTYDILETEMLIKEQQFAKGHTKHEAQMILNHKYALDEIFQHSSNYKEFSEKNFLDLHEILTKDLGVKKGIRNKKVRIAGSDYIPPFEEKVIQKGVSELIKTINSLSDPLEKAFTLLVLNSYLQAFEDGNKRTARISSNAILLAHNHCPLSYRSVNPLEYKKSLLIFYEQNSFQNFKKLFIEQYIFSSGEYFG